MATTKNCPLCIAGKRHDHVFWNGRIVSIPAKGTSA